MQKLLKDIRTNPNASTLVRECARSQHVCDLAQYLAERTSYDTTAILSFLDVFHAQGCSDADIAEICAELRILVDVCNNS